MNALSRMDRIFLLHTFLSVVAQCVSMLTPAAAAADNAWGIGLYDLGKVAEIFPHLEGLTRFILTPTV